MVDFLKQESVEIMFVSRYPFQLSMVGRGWIMAMESDVLLRLRNVGIKLK